MSDVSEVKVRRGVFSLYDHAGEFVGQVSTGSGRALIGDAFYARERTCHIKLSKTSVWHCDGCGQTIDGNCFADNGGRLTEYRYCPNCGAKVVDE